MLFIFDENKKFIFNKNKISRIMFENGYLIFLAHFYGFKFNTFR